MEREPAFPSIEGFANNYGQLTAKGGAPGMTLRDYFAAKAMQAMLTADLKASMALLDSSAVWAYACADEMLKARQS